MTIVLIKWNTSWSIINEEYEHPKVIRDIKIDGVNGNTNDKE